MTVTARTRARVPVGVLLLVCVLAQLTAAAPTAAAAAAAEPRHRTGGEVTAEARLFDRHNAARTDPAAFGQPGAGAVAPLRWAEDLAAVARAWADTMAATEDFVGNPAVAAQVCCALAVTQNVAYVEGIGLYYTIEGAADRVVELLMASPAHRGRLPGVVGRRVRDLADHVLARAARPPRPDGLVPRARHRGVGRVAAP